MHILHQPGLPPPTSLERWQGPIGVKSKEYAREKETSKKANEESSMTANVITSSGREDAHLSDGSDLQYYTCSCRSVILC